jgi:hypothetical protein
MVMNIATLYAPRTYLTKENGFSQLAAAGMLIEWGNEKFTLEPDGL